MADPVRDVLLLVADQWRGDALGLLGTPGVHTPNLDALAAEGVTFTNHWCQASPCGPSRRSLLTGTEVRVHGQWTNDGVGRGDLPTLAGAARATGRRPMLIGYTDTPSPDWDPALGWAATGGPTEDAATESAVGRSLYDPAFELVRPFFWQLGFPAYRRHLAEHKLGPPLDDLMGIYPPAGPPGRLLAPSRVPAEHSDTAWLTDAALDLLDTVDEPLLLHLNWLRPHPPLIPPTPYDRLVDPDDVEPPRRGLSLAERCDQHPFFATAASRRQLQEYLQERRSVADVTEADDRRLRAGYYGLLAEVDHHLGRVIDRLRSTGRWETTMVIVLSDHGDALGDRWLYGRRGPFDGHFRVPCLIRDPRPTAAGTRGTLIDGFTTNADVLPTILEAIGGVVPPEVSGRSLSGLIEGQPDTDEPDHVRYEMDWSDHGPRDDANAGALRFVAVRTERYRYVDFGTLPPLLFDLQEDPLELVDRAVDPALREVRNDLHALTR
ncbi:MAG: sulfatase-like hydrolase/transferase [Actinomycetota bacterium]